MEELTPEQKNLLVKFIEILINEQKRDDLQKVLNLFEENKIQSILNKIDEIDKSYNYIEKLKEDAEVGHRGIEDTYWRIFQKNSEGKIENQVLIDIQNKMKKLQEDYQYFYDIKDSRGNVTQGIITRLAEACQD